MKERRFREGTSPAANRPGAGVTVSETRQCASEVGAISVKALPASKARRVSVDGVIAREASTFG